MKASIYTLGCKVNQYESQMMAELLQKAGFEIVSSNEDADLYVINSCTVTAVSDQKTRQSVRHFKRSHPNSIVILTGCMPQAYPEIAEQLVEADIVLSNSNNDDLLTLINDYCLNHKRLTKVVRHQTGEAFADGAITSFSERTRAFVKIEDGCDRFCSYCIIPTARGRVRSKPLENLLKEATTLAQNGITELVLVGINLSAYGKGTEYNLCNAVHTACSVDGITRVRLGSLEPDHLTPAILKQLSCEKKLCPQFHISLQSGCDATLKRMNRHYTTRQYAELCDTLRTQFNDCTLTTDVMVGFPSESDAEFKESLSFVQAMGFEKVHVFPYSPRTGTPAAKLEQLDKALKQERSHQMIAVTTQSRAAFLANQVGLTLRVLVESKNASGLYEGYTANYTPVRTESQADLRTQMVDVTIVRSDDEYCYGISK